VVSQNSSASGSSSQSRLSSLVLKCYHNEVSPLRVVRHNGPRLGMQFYACAYWPISKATCGFFSWVDDVNLVQDMHFQILDKDTTITNLENEVKMLKEENENLEDQLDEVGIECNERRLMMECEADDKRKTYALLLSWVFFAIMFWMS
ncbi:Endonuclease 8-like 3, partial [Bienertia sinuspersici]